MASAPKRRRGTAAYVVAAVVQKMSSDDGCASDVAVTAATTCAARAPAWSAVGSHSPVWFATTDAVSHSASSHRARCHLARSASPNEPQLRAPPGDAITPRATANAAHHAPCTIVMRVIGETNKCASASLLTER